MDEGNVQTSSLEAATVLQEECGTIPEEGGALYKIFVTPGKYQPKSQRKSKTPKRKVPEDNSVESDQPKDKGRPRTPSGQVLTSSIGDIKSLLEAQVSRASSPFVFSQGRNPANRIPPQQSKDSAEHGNYDQHDLRCVNDLKQQTEQFLLINKHFNLSGSDKVVESEAVSSIRDQSNGRSVNTSPIRTSTDKKQKDKSFSMCDKGKRSEASESIEEANKMEVGPEESADPILKAMAMLEQQRLTNPTIDIRTVIQMFEDLKTSITNTIKEEMKTNHQECKVNEDLQVKHRLLEARVHLCENKERALANTMSVMNERMRELQMKLEISEANNAKRAFVLSGFEASEKKTHLQKTSRSVSAPGDASGSVHRRPILHRQ